MYRKITQLLESGERVALITVVSTTGSAPGKVGYKMLVHGIDAATEGTVGGGLTEAEVTDTAKSMLKETSSKILRFDLGGTGDGEHGICGGSIEFLIETFDCRCESLFRELSTAIAADRKGILVSLIRPPAKPKKFFFKDLEQAGAVDDLSLSADILESTHKIIEKQESRKLVLADGAEMFIETVAEQPMLFLFGAGHLAHHIARFADSLGFRLTVCDERSEYANAQRFPNADSIVVEDYHHIFNKISIDNDSYIVIVTRGHKCDQLVLEETLGRNPKYIGMIGSKTKTMTIVNSLFQKGIPAAKLSRVYSPVGISIGAVTPEEIALSIVCELTKVRRLGDSPDVGHMKLDFLGQSGQQSQ
jgi:xanthine dehydrogenase accessory factor